MTRLSSSRSGSRFENHSVALALEQLDRPPPDLLSMAPVVVVGARLTVRGALGQEVVHHPEHRMRDRHHGFLVSTMPHDAAVPRPPRAVGAGRGPRGFDEGGA